MKIIKHGMAIPDEACTEIAVDRMCKQINLDDAVSRTLRSNESSVGDLVEAIVEEKAKPACEAEPKLWGAPVIIQGGYTDEHMLAALACLGPPPPWRLNDDPYSNRGRGFHAVVDERIDWIVRTQCFCVDAFGGICNDFATEYDSWWKSKQALGEKV